MAKIRPPAHLQPREGDVLLTGDEMQKISLFTGLKEQPDWEEYPGAAVLRQYRPGETICQVGEPGWTAFYILRGEDILSLRERQLQDFRTMAELPLLTGELEAELTQLRASAATKEPRKVARVYSAKPTTVSGWERLKQRFWPAKAGGSLRWPR